MRNYIFLTIHIITIQFSSVLSHVWLFATPWTAACQASLSISNTQSLPKLMSIESMMPSNHLILCRPLFLLPSIFPNIRVFSSESALCIRWPDLMLMIFFPAILIPAYASSSPAFLMMYSAYKLNKQVTKYSYDVLLFLFGTSLLFHMKF